MFGGFGAYHKFRAMRDQAKDAPRREVTREQFIAACIASGMSKGDAELQAKVNSVMGAETLIGNEMLSIKKAAK